MKKNAFYTAIISIFIITTAYMLNSCSTSNSEDESSMHREYLAVRPSNGSTWNIIDKNGQVVVETDFRTDASSISNVFDDVYWVRFSNGRRQLFSVNRPNQPLLDEEAADVADFVYCGYTFVATRNQPIRIINTKGETVATLPESIKECRSFCKDGYALIKSEDGKFGVVDINGKIVIEPTYTNLAPLGEGVFLAELYQFLNAQGNILGEIDHQKYTVINLGIEGGKFVVRDANYNNPQCYVINTKGDQMFAIQADTKAASFYRGGYAIIQNSYDQWGVVDDNGNVVISPQYSMLFNVGGGNFIAMENGRFGVINTKNETIIDFSYGGFDTEKLGDNFVMEKGYEYMLVNGKGEQLATFKKIGQADHPVAYRMR